MCIPGIAALIALQMLDIGRAGIVGMDAALQTDLGGAAIPRFLRAANDLLHLQVVRRAAQRLVRLAFGEGAELATIIADVGVVDVAVDDVTDDLAADRRGAVRRPTVITRS